MANHKVQAIVIGVVLFASTALGTLGIAVLADADPIRCEHVEVTGRPGTFLV